MVNFILTALLAASLISALPAKVDIRSMSCNPTTVTLTILTSATTSTPLATTATHTSQTIIPVSRAGGFLNPSAAAAANPFDATATRIFKDVTIRSSTNLCLTINPTAGDFREELIPVTLASCSGSSAQNFNFITAGKHINVSNSTLIVSSLMNGCLNFDPRRAAGDTVIIFSCGGRADGQGSVTNSQLFAFQDQKSLKLQPENGNGKVCLAPNASGRLDQAVCGSDPNQEFTVV
jgi:hypothetical protein